ncbi:MAG: four helix bundle protein [Patescibacteria group bacterium]|nr:four helix bundle protein [Patescibacteria group bacterium]
MLNGGYIKLGKLFVYKISIELCDMGWKIYELLDWKDRKILGDQFIRAVDSNAANIAEGYGRYHYLDRIKFYYNARASLLESKHWTLLLYKRKKIDEERYNEFLKLAEQVSFELNKFIKTSYNSKKTV